MSLRVDDFPLELQETHHLDLAFEFEKRILPDAVETLIAFCSACAHHQLFVLLHDVNRCIQR